MFLLASSCSSSPHIESKPVDLSAASAEPDEAPTPASGAAPQVDWRGIPAERRREVIGVLETTFCPACLCAESVARCLTPDEPCGCPDCADVMARFVLDGFRNGMSGDEILDLSADAWVDAFEREPVDLPLQSQPTREATRAGEPISVVEFADFLCSHCASTAPILDALVENQPDVQLTFFFYPLQRTGPSILAAQAAQEAFVQGQFWSYARALYQQPRPPDRDDLVALAEQVELDGTRMATALDDERHREAVWADRGLGQAVGVEGTPAIYIEGRPFVLPRTLDNLEIWVDMERTRRQCNPGAS